MTIELTKLEHARRNVAADEVAIAAIDADLAAAARERAVIDARIASHQARRTAALANKAAAERALGEAEQEALDQHCVELAAATIKLHNDNPLRNRNRVIANLNLLRRAVRTPLHWPINKVYFIEPICQQALALLPPRDALDTPVNELGGRGAPWEQRRKQFLAEFEAADKPPQAA